MPWYLKALGIDTYGAWLASGNVVGLLGVLDVGVSSVLYQRLGEAWGAGDRKRFTATVGAGGLVVAVLTALICVGGGALAAFVPDWVHAPAGSSQKLSVAFLLATLGAAGSILSANLLAVSAAWQRGEIGASARILGQVVETAAIAIGLYLGLGAVALGLGSLLGSLATVSIGLLWTGKIWRRLDLGALAFSRGDLFGIARATAPIMVSRVVLQIDGNIEVAMVAALVNPAAAAVYAITDRILRTAMSFINPIAGSTVSGLAHFVGERGPREALRPAQDLLALWAICVAATLPILLALNQDFTSLWVGADKYGGASLNAALFANEVLGGREWVFSVLLLASGGVAVSAWIGTIESLVRMPLMYLALRAFGWVGLPLSQAGVSVFALVAYARHTGRQLRLDSGEWLGLLSRGALPVLLSLVVAIAELFALPHATTWPTFGAKGGLLLLVHLAIAWFASPREPRTLFRELFFRLVRRVFGR